MLQEKTFDTGVTTINYAEGSSPGPPMVLLHGLSGRWQGLQGLIEQLSPSWHIYACDLRGHGKSGHVTDGYRLKDYTQDIAAFLQDKVAEPIVLLGHSLGALTALSTAAQVPEHVRALVLLDPPLFVRNTSTEEAPSGVKDWFSWVHETTQTAQSYADVLERCRQMMPDADETGTKQLAEQICSLDPDTVGTVLRDQLLEGFDFENTLRHIACPTLLLYGEWSLGAVVRDEDADFVRTTVPRVTVIKIPEVGHMLHEEQLETVLEHMNAFLNPFDS